MFNVTTKNSFFRLFTDLCTAYCNVYYCGTNPLTRHVVTAQITIKRFFSKTTNELTKIRCNGNWKQHRLIHPLHAQTTCWTWVQSANQMKIDHTDKRVYIYIGPFAEIEHSSSLTLQTFNNYNTVQMKTEPKTPTSSGPVFKSRQN